MRWTLTVIWLIFAVLFLFLGRLHWTEARSAIAPLEITQRQMDRPGSGVQVQIRIKGTDLDEPLQNFVRDFNGYLSKQNEASRTANERAAYGYFLASATAFVSLCLAAIESKPKK